jgi:hypothetical protein
MTTKETVTCVTEMSIHVAYKQQFYTGRTSSRNNGKITICFHSITEISFMGCKMFPLQGHNIFSYGSPHTQMTVVYTYLQHIKDYRY